MTQITKMGIIQLMKDTNVYEPPRKKKLQSSHEHEKILTAYLKRIDILSSRLELVAEAYEDNFVKLSNLTKHSRDHLKAVIIDELLNAESYRLRVALRIRPKDPKQEKGVVGSGGPTKRKN